MNKIAELNDKFRTTFQGGRLVTTATFASLPEATKAKVLETVRTFSTFTPDNDPYGEHDLAIFEVDGERFMFKIDYYDAACVNGSEDPSDPSKTIRVMTVMLSEDY